MQKRPKYTFKKGLVTDVLLTLIPLAATTVKHWCITFAILCNAFHNKARFENVVDKYGLKLCYKIRKPRITDSTHGLPTYPNLIKNFMSIGPNQLWLSDITYIPIFNGDINYWFCYLSIIMDAYTEEIKGYCVGNSLEIRCSIIAIKMALKNLKGHNMEKNSIVHLSDRGVQYASNKYISLLKTNNLRL